MKNQIQPKVASFLAFFLVSFAALAQDGKLLDIDIDVNKNEWYENPYIWIGVAIFIVLLVAVSRMGGKK